MIRAAICEDSPQDRARLRSMLEECGVSLELTEYSSAEAMMWDVESKKVQFDLYLLDIYLKGISGLEAAQALREVDRDAMLIFTSVSDDFYRDAFDVYAFNYLIKPIEQEALNKVIESAMERLQQRRERILTVTYRGHTYLLRHELIEYISSSNHTLRFHLHNGEERVCYGRLDQIAEQLDAQTFVRCHQSYIVNLRYVVDRMPKGFRMTNSIVPISRSHANAVEAALNRYLFGIFERS